MEIVNRSRACQVALLTSVVQFVSRYCKYLEKAKILVADAGSTCKFGKGRASLVNPLGGSPSLIQLWLVPGDAKRLSCAVPVLPPVEAEGLAEQLVLLLAHEARHLEQFWTKRYAMGQEVEAEVDAESFARRVLALYRLDTYTGVGVASLAGGRNGQMAHRPRARSRQRQGEAVL